MNTKKIVGIPMLLGLFVCTMACDDVIFEEDITQSYVRILAPTPQAQLTAGKINFNWEPIEGSDEYHIQIATPNFDSAKQIVLDSLVLGTDCNKLLAPGEYEWRVRGENSAYQTTYFYSDFSIIEVAEEP